MADGPLLGGLALTGAHLISVGEGHSGSRVPVAVEGEVVLGNIC
jgi:hypothetical protein